MNSAVAEGVYVVMSRVNRSYVCGPRLMGNFDVIGVQRFFPLQHRSRYGRITRHIVNVSVTSTM